MTARARIPRGVVCTLAVVAATFGCRGSVPEAAVPSRLYDQPPVIELDATDLLDVKCAQEFDLTSGTLPDPIELVEGRIHPGSQGGISLVGGSTAPRLRLRETLQGSEIQGLWMEIDGVRRGQIEVERIPLRKGAAPRTTVVKPRASGTPRSRYLFDFRPDPIDQPFRIEIRPTTAAGEIVTLSHLCLSREVGRVRDLDKLEAGAWKITLDSETRDALLLDGNGRKDRFRIGPRARFSFGLGLVSGSGGDFSVEVTARGAGGPRVVLPPEPWHVDETAPAWRDFVVDLSSLRPGDWELETRVLAGDGQTRLFAYSAPEVRSIVAGPQPPDIVLVVIDTLRADHVSLYGYERPTTPQLDAWAGSNATVFEHAVAPAGWTLPSHFSLFTGLNAFRHSANYYRGSFDASSYRFLASELWRSGYRTRAITGGSFVSPDFGLATGFESFRYWQRGFGSDDELPAHVRAAERLIDASDGPPTFLFLHTYEVHTPNPARQPFFGQFSRLPSDYSVQLVTDPPDVERGFEGSLHAVLDRNGSRIDPIPQDLAALPADAYDSAIADVDSQLGPLLERLAERESTRPTVVVVTADHGESLALERAGHGYLTPDNLAVPLLISIPGRQGGRRIGAQVRLIDLYSTLLELAGVAVPDGVDARSLLPILDAESPAGRAAFAYAASMNYGMAKIDPDGWMVSWRNSPWRPISGNSGSQRLYRGGPAEPARSVADTVRELQRLYERSAPGLRCEISTSAAGPVRVEVSSDLVDPVATKSSAPPRPGLEWLAIGRLRADLAAGQPLRLVFERLTRDPVGLEVTVERPDLCPARAQASIGGPLAALRNGKSFSIELPPCPGAPPGGHVDVRLRLAGGVPSDSISAGTAELERELRALGYLE